MFYSPLGCMIITTATCKYHVSNQLTEEFEVISYKYQVIKTPHIYTPSDHYDTYETEIPTDIQAIIDVVCTTNNDGLTPWQNI